MGFYLEDSWHVKEEEGGIKYTQWTGKGIYDFLLHKAAEQDHSINSWQAFKSTFSKASYHIYCTPLYNHIIRARKKSCSSMEEDINDISSL